MKKKILVGVLLAVFLIMALPSIPAAELSLLKDSNETLFSNELQSQEILSIVEKIKTGNNLGTENGDLNVVFALALILIALSMIEEEPYVALLLYLLVIRLII